MGFARFRAGRKLSRAAVVPRYALLLIMSPLLLSMLGLSVAVHQPCAVLREIAPCTCKVEYSKTWVNCAKMSSFAQTISLLENKFPPKDRIVLRISESNLSDMTERSFKEFNMTIDDLKLIQNDLSELTPFTFSGLQHVKSVSLADNPIPYMPIQVFEMMPKIKTLDIGRMHLKNIPEDSFAGLPNLETLILPGNMIYKIDRNAIPSTVVKLHLGRNAIKDLNGSLRHLTELQWLFINGNELETLEDQLPLDGMKLRMIHVANNQIVHLPEEFKSYVNLDNLFLQNNLLVSLDGALSKSRKLIKVNLENNRISTLHPDDFTETENLQMLQLQHNLIHSLNNSLLPLKKLKLLNLTDNRLTSFSWHDIRTLQDLRYLDLSYNRIKHLTGLTPNMVEWDTKLKTLNLDHNELQSLDGALSGLRSLVRLNLSFNKITRISPDDLIGLDQLTMLDVSHNQITTLEETSKTFLPALEELIASHNFLTVLDKDFHGLPVLCWADLSNNKIVALGRDLVSKTHCKIRDGVHEDNFGTLKIYLKDNPILCDAALPEINSAMELNHTKIVGLSHCPPLSEQPVTDKPNGFLGYIPEMSTTATLQQQPQENLYKVEPNNNNEAGNLQDLNYQTVGQEQFVQMRHSHGLHQPLLEPPLPYQTNYNSEQVVPPPIIQEHPVEVSEETSLMPKIEESHLPTAPLEEIRTEVLQENFDDVNNATHEKIIENTSQEPETGTPIAVIPTVTELPLNDHPIYRNVDPAVHERQIVEMASEIEQLRSRVKELSHENQRLTENLELLSENNNPSPVLVYEHLVEPASTTELPEEKRI